MLQQFFILLIIFSSVFGKKQIPIGAIFNKNEEAQEMVFRATVERINMYERNLELIPIIMVTDLEDSLVIEKKVCEMIAQGALAIFGPSSRTSGIVSVICSTLEIPHIVYNWAQENNNNEQIYHSMTLNVYPDNLLLSRAYADIIRQFSWRSFTVVYETEQELIQLEDILQIHDPSSNPISVRQIKGDYDYRPFLKTIKTSGESCIILHCSTDKIISILRQANELNMLGEYQSFFVAPLDTHIADFNELQSIDANLTTIRLADLSSFEVKTAIYDWEQYQKRNNKAYGTIPHNPGVDILLLHDALWIFAKGINELRIINEITPPGLECKNGSSWPLGKQVYNFIKARTEEGTTGRIGFNEKGYRTYFSLEVLELSSSGFQVTAIWDPIKGVRAPDTDIDISAKKVEEKFATKLFIVTSRIGSPFLDYRTPKDGEILEGNACYEGYSMDLIDSISKILGFKYRFELTPDGRYGSYDADTKRWNGLIGQILEGKADLGICDLTMTSARRQVVDFTPPFMTLGISILYSKPENAPPDLFSFLLPFSLDVWIYMATAYLGVSLLLYALARMAPAEWENPHPCNPEPEELENVWAITNTTWLTMGSIMGQGCDILPKSLSTRLVTGMWWFFALMMLNSYTANLAAFLTMSRMDSSIESAEDLAKQSKIKYGAVDGGSTMAFFKGSNFSTYQKMWAAMESARPSVFTKTNNEGIERVLKSKRMYAFFMESTSLEYTIERNCELRQVGGWLDYKTYGIAMPFNSPFRKQISKAVLQLGESGQLAELKRKWWKEKKGGGKCSQATQENLDTPELGVDNVGGVFLVLGSGLFVALFIGVLEFLWNVKKVAIEEKITPWQALKAEMSFAVRFWINIKPVRTSSNSDSSNSKRSSKSVGPLSETRSTKSTNTNTNGNQNSSFLSLKSFRSEKENKKNNLI